VTTKSFLTPATGNDIVEPSILYDASAPFLGYEYVMCAGPYYQANAIYENPCLWVSHNGATWVPVVNGAPTPGYSGTATPIFGQGVQGDGNNSDPYLVRGPDGTFYILWNQFLTATTSGGTGTGGNNWGVKISKASSLAGPWSTPVAALATVVTTTRPSSPSLIWDGRQWHMYAVDNANISATSLVRYTNPSADPTQGTWTLQTAPAAVLPTGYTGQVWWHLNAYLSGSQHVLIIQDNAAGSSAGGNLWVITSDDEGITWSVPSKPAITSTHLYRSAAVFGDGSLDLFVGRLGSSWELHRTRLALTGGSATAATQTILGGVNPSGVPVHALAMTAAKLPVSPYVFGDTVNRADSASSAGTADSGQAYTAASGTVGISSKKLYAPTAGNNKAVIATTGCADGVSAAQIQALDTASSQYLLFRYTDASNFVRFGTNGTHYVVDDVVAGSVANTNTFAGVTPAAGDVIAAIHQGSTITCYANGLLIGSVTGYTGNASASGVGVQISGVNGRLNNLYQRPLVNGA
jgi:hypothetical protein